MAMSEENIASRCTVSASIRHDSWFMPSTCSPRDVGVKMWTSSQNSSTSLLTWTVASVLLSTKMVPRDSLMPHIHFYLRRRPSQVSVNKDNKIPVSTITGLRGTDCVGANARHVIRDAAPVYIVLQSSQDASTNGPCLGR